MLILFDQIVYFALKSVCLVFPLMIIGCVIFDTNNQSYSQYFKENYFLFAVLILSITTFVMIIFYMLHIVSGGKHHISYSPIWDTVSLSLFIGMWLICSAFFWFPFTNTEKSTNTTQAIIPINEKASVRFAAVCSVLQMLCLFTNLLLLHHQPLLFYHQFFIPASFCQIQQDKRLKQQFRGFVCFRLVTTTVTVIVMSLVASVNRQECSPSGECRAKHFINLFSFYLPYVTIVQIIIWSSLISVCKPTKWVSCIPFVFSYLWMTAFAEIYDQLSTVHSASILKFLFASGFSFVNSVVFFLEAVGIAVHSDMYFYRHNKVSLFDRDTRSISDGSARSTLSKATTAASSRDYLKSVKAVHRYPLVFPVDPNPAPAPTSNINTSKV